MDSLLEHDADILRPPWGPVGRDLTLGVVSGLAKLLLHGLNAVAIAPGDLARYRALATERAPGVGLLTYCNHTSTFDDPGLPSALLPWSLFWTEHTHEKMRWTMCAADVCFKNALLSQFFGNGKTLRVDRGSSVHQPVIAAAGRLLGAGGWMHVFPEGKVQPRGDVGPFRQGIGKLVCDSRAVAGRDPIVLPYFHSGMGRVMPYMSSLPRAGHEVTVVVGEPVDLSAVTCRCNVAGEDQVEVWRDIAALLREALLDLERRAPPNPNQLEERPELQAVIEARCRKSRRRGGGDSSGERDGVTPANLSVSAAGGAGADGSGGSTPSSSTGSVYVAVGPRRERYTLASAAVALADPCKVWSSYCEVLSKPPWLPDQEHRQLLFAEVARGWQPRWRQQAQEQAAAQQREAPLPPLRWLRRWRALRGRDAEGPYGSEQQHRAAAGVPRPRLWALWQRKRPVAAAQEQPQTVPGEENAD